MQFEFELKKVVRRIKRAGVKRVLLQLPDGLKPYATQIAKQIEEKSRCRVLIWAGSCFGACDIPRLEVDLIIQFGHSEVRKWLR
jgi:2-(3-amino-3-carboxypropyl)histidine synthase